MVDYTEIITQMGEILEFVLPMGILFGTVQRVVNWIIRAATGRTEV